MAEEHVSQFYAKVEDEERCVQSALSRQPVMITGLTAEGQVWAFRGIVQSIEMGPTQYPSYPFRITMLDAD